LVLAGQLMMLHAHLATVLVPAGEKLWLHAQFALAKLAHM
jgi:hypothetical protein